VVIVSLVEGDLGGLLCFVEWWGGGFNNIVFYVIVIVIWIEIIDINIPINLLRIVIITIEVFPHTILINNPIIFFSELVVVILQLL